MNKKVKINHYLKQYNIHIIVIKNFFLKFLKKNIFQNSVNKNLRK